MSQYSNTQGTSPNNLTATEVKNRIESRGESVEYKRVVEVLDQLALISMESTMAKLMTDLYLIFWNGLSDETRKATMLEF